MVPGAGVEPARMFSPRDFKSLVSTNFTTWASGGTIQSRTGLDGFAIHYITALLSYHLERETRIELATVTLARLCSTN